MKAATLLTLVLLTGCATTHYSTVHCITKEQYEQLQKDKPGKIHDQLNGQADHDIKPIAGRLVRVEAWGDGLLTILGGCIG